MSAPGDEAGLPTAPGCARAASNSEPPISTATTSQTGYRSPLFGKLGFLLKRHLASCTNFDVPSACPVPGNCARTSFQGSRPRRIE